PRWRPRKGVPADPGSCQAGREHGAGTPSREHRLKGPAGHAAARGAAVNERRYATPEEAFEARTEPLAWSGCLVWTGHLNHAGYGRLWVDGRMVLAHRYAWEQENGPIPD